MCARRCLKVRQAGSIEHEYCAANTGVSKVFQSRMA